MILLKTIKGISADGRLVWETLPPWRTASRKWFRIVLSVTVGR